MTSASFNCGGQKAAKLRISTACFYDIIWPVKKQDINAILLPGSYRGQIL